MDNRNATLNIDRDILLALFVYIMFIYFGAGCYLVE